MAKHIKSHNNNDPSNDNLDTSLVESGEEKKVFTPLSKKEIFSRSTKERVFDLFEKMENIIEKGYQEIIDPKNKKSIGIHGVANLTGNYIKLLEITRELDLDTGGGIDTYEIIALAPPELREQFQLLWAQLLQNYADIKNINLEDLLS